MIDEGFCLSRALRYAEYVGKQFFDDEEVWLGGESCVEGKYRPGAFETVPRKMEFGHGVYWVYPLAVVLLLLRWRFSQFWRCILTVGPFGALLIQM